MDGGALGAAAWKSQTTYLGNANLMEGGINNSWSLARADTWPQSTGKEPFVNLPREAHAAPIKSF